MVIHPAFLLLGQNLPMHLDKMSFGAIFVRFGVINHFLFYCWVLMLILVGFVVQFVIATPL
ncbi:hypothetical protein GCM10007105_13270 [Shewanella chilikensis]|nr:hypothetical protein GCM10007105_13270 [Shewanella chilikensis]